MGYVLLNLALLLGSFSDMLIIGVKAYCFACRK